MTDFGGKTSIFSHPVYLFLRKFSLQDSRGGSDITDGIRLSDWYYKYKKSSESNVKDLPE
ncbi:hypothetical protein [Escherichia coli]|uniref:hypothetical protein n=1 Tax=Escherichia coli TaxID=562 RepID=UPI00202693E6|nr:hypothetical protein [Escherichia coli]